MKSHLFLLLIAFALLSCESDESTGNESHDVVLDIRPSVEVTSDKFGRTKTNPDSLLTYLAVVVKDAEGYDYAKGLFDNGVDSIKLSLLGDQTYQVFVQATRKGWSHGLWVLDYSTGVRKLFNTYTITNKMVYDNSVITGGRLTGDANVYTSADSANQRYYLHPSTDSWFKTIEISSGATSDFVQVNLDRQIFAVKTKLVNFPGGRVNVLIGGGNSSEQIINYPDTTSFSGYSFYQFWPDVDENVAVKIIYTYEGNEQVIYNEQLHFSRLEKKTFKINFAGTPGGKGITVSLKEESLYDGEVIEIGG